LFEVLLPFFHLIQF